MEINKIYNEDCLEGMKRIPDKSVDMILCDLPYGTTACKWDAIIPFEPLWEQYERVIKDNGAIVLTASQPFTTKLINSNIGNFKYTWVWNKKNSSTALLAKIQPLRIHEDIIVFYKKKPTYNPQMTKGKPRKDFKKNVSNGEAFNNAIVSRVYDNSEGLYYPKSILEISNANQRNRLHPTQKPVALFEYLIKTYTNEGETVLDNCMGSGTTACKWDTIIPFELLWEQYERIIKDNGAIVLTASQPFTSALVMSNPKLFRHSWVWNKRYSANYPLAKIQPMKIHEDIVVFSKKRANYTPIMTKRDIPIKKGTNKGAEVFDCGLDKEDYVGKIYDEKYPESIIFFPTRQEGKKIHPTQKPVALFEYLIKTYTNEGETVLDNCMGSGTTAIACINTDRNYIGFELDEEYYKASLNRIEEHIKTIDTL